MLIKSFFFLLLALSLLSCNKNSIETFIVLDEPIIKIDTLLTGYEIIWGMDFLPNGDLIFSEKKGKLYRRTTNGVINEITGIPLLNSGGQGGLLDICIHPNYSQNSWIYCTYSSNSGNGVSGGVWNLARFKINQNYVTNWQKLLSSNSANLWLGHYGSRITFDNKGYIFVSVGEGGITSYGGVNTTNSNSQDAQSIWGKVHRLFDNGTVPTDNPILPGNAGPTSVYTYGHRNPQGLAFNLITSEMWEGEHGPNGGDELNIIKKGGNYGWPLVSYGINYDGVAISNGPLLVGIEPAVYTWTPSIAPSGMSFITSDKFKAWKGNLLVSSLAYKYLSRCVIENSRVIQEFKMLQDVGRVRNVKQSPDGSIYISVEGPGRILKMTAE